MSTSASTSTVKVVLFDTARPGERFPGHLTVGAESLAFRDQQGHDRVLPLDRLQCRSGGIENKTIYFSHPDHAGIEIVSHDFELLLRPPLSELATVAAAVASAKGYGRRYWGLIGCVALGVIVLGGGVLFVLLRLLFGIF